MSSSSPRPRIASRPDVSAKTAVHPRSVLVIPRETNGELAMLSATSRTPTEDFQRILSEMKGNLERHRLVDVAAQRAEWLVRSRAVASGSYRVLPGLKVLTIDFGSKSQRDDVSGEIQSFAGGGAFDVIDDFALALPTLAEMEESREWQQDDHRHLEWAEVSGIAKAHSGGVTGRGSVVGVLDTGLDADHYEFSGRTIPFRHIPYRYEQKPRDVRAYDTSGHGTHVASLIAGNRRGISKGAELLASYVIESETLATSASRVARGLEWLIEKFDEPERADLKKIINLSLGFDESLIRQQVKTNTEDRLRQCVLAMNAMVRLAAGSGRTAIFAAIGNSGPNRPCYPAMSPGVCSVGSMGTNGNVSGFSSTSSDGKHPILHGIGERIFSATDRSCSGQDRYGFSSGTSMATPYCSAIAALTWERHPKLSPTELVQRLVDSGQSFNGKVLARYAP